MSKTIEFLMTISLSSSLSVYIYIVVDFNMRFGLFVFVLLQGYESNARPIQPTNYRPVYLYRPLRLWSSPLPHSDKAKHFVVLMIYVALRVLAYFECGMNLDWRQKRTIKKEGKKEKYHSFVIAYLLLLLLMMSLLLICYYWLILLQSLVEFLIPD